MAELAKEYNSDYWHKNVTEAPEVLNFWFDFMDADGEMGKYAISAIGNRPKAINDDKVKAIYFSFLVLESTKKPSGKNVMRAISLAMSIDAKYVINTNAIIAERVVLKIFTILLASMRKKLMCLSAEITASITNKLTNVLKSK